MTPYYFSTLLALVENVLLSLCIYAIRSRSSQASAQVSASARVYFPTYPIRSVHGFYQVLDFLPFQLESQHKSLLELVEPSGSVILGR